MKTRRDAIAIGQRGSVSSETFIPKGAETLLVYAHGAGAPMDHPFMVQTALALAEHGIATLRFNFLYAEAGRKRPDHRSILLETLDAVLEHAASAAGGRRLVAGGKSMGGRMLSHVKLDNYDVSALLFFGFPLHAPGKTGNERAAHLADVAVPMLFLQGTRDRLAKLESIGEVVRDLGAGVRLHIVDGADHGFHVLKRSGRTDEEVIGELAETAARFIADVGAGALER